MVDSTLSVGNKICDTVFVSSYLIFGIKVEYSKITTLFGDTDKRNLAFHL